MNPRFLNIKTSQRLEQPSHFFTMNCLLCSRTELGLLSERDNYVEDVDVYLEQLLATFADPDVFERSRRYLSKYDGEVFKRLRRSELGHVRYRILRTTSDFFLVSACTFATPPLRRGRTKQEPIEEGYIGRGKTYYHFAYSYSQRLHRPNTVISEVLEKLSVGFDRYARILAHMRGEKKEDLLARLSKGEVFILERVVNRELEETTFEEKQDHLLDAIAEYHRTRTSESRERVARLAADMEAMRPDFHYDLGRLDTPAFRLRPDPAPPGAGGDPRKSRGSDSTRTSRPETGGPRLKQDSTRPRGVRDASASPRASSEAERDSTLDAPGSTHDSSETVSDVPGSDGAPARPRRRKSDPRREPPETPH